MSEIERICLDIDKRIKTVYLDQDNVACLKVTGIMEQDEEVKNEIYYLIITQENSRVIDEKMSICLQTPVHSYPNFENFFCVVIHNVVSVLSMPNGYESLIGLPSFKKTSSAFMKNSGS